MRRMPFEDGRAARERCLLRRVAALAVWLSRTMGTGTNERTRRGPARAAGSVWTNSRKRALADTRAPIHCGTA